MKEIIWRISRLLFYKQWDQSVTRECQAPISIMVFWRQIELLFTENCFTFHPYLHIFKYGIYDLMSMVPYIVTSSHMPHKCSQHKFEYAYIEISTFELDLRRFDFSLNNYVKVSYNKGTSQTIRISRKRSIFLSPISESETNILYRFITQSEIFQAFILDILMIMAYI